MEFVQNVEIKPQYPGTRNEICISLVYSGNGNKISFTFPLYTRETQILFLVPVNINMKLELHKFNFNKCNSYWKAVHWIQFLGLWVYLKYQKKSRDISNQFFWQLIHKNWNSTLGPFANYVTEKIYKLFKIL
jgi:hypothetical protein